MAKRWEEVECSAKSQRKKGGTLVNVIDSRSSGIGIIGTLAIESLPIDERDYHFRRAFKDIEGVRVGEERVFE